MIGAMWTDCTKYLPYRDYLGRWQIPRDTQKRIVLGRVEYREKPETEGDYAERQW